MCGTIVVPGRFLTKFSNDSYDCIVSGSMERKYAWKTISSKYRLRFCKAEGNLSHPVTPKPSLVRTLGGEFFLLPLTRNLFTSDTRFFN